MPQQPQDAEGRVRLLALALYASALIVAIGAIGMGVTVSPALFALLLVSVVDIVIARMFVTGKIGPLADRQKAVEAGSAGEIAEGDPSFNPYARED